MVSWIDFFQFYNYRYHTHVSFQLQPSCVTLKVDELRRIGVEKVVAVTVNSPEVVQALASKVLPSTSNGIELLADKNGGLMRLLGVEIGTPDSSTEPRCQRFAAIVEDGILMKLVSVKQRIN